ncbi:RNA polymerase II subunit A C-terminal domain phosphatase [Arachis hypogaea]|nr:RNA polymerase II subunit A C-terminal domain phosphatase [Arachis hypogaea]
MAYRDAIVCLLNKNKNIEVHFLLKRQGFNVSSCGTGVHIKLRGPSLRELNVYDFEVRVVVSELLAEEDGGHELSLLVRRGENEVCELQEEGVGIGLLAEVEERLSVGAQLFGGRH